jgi:uncharacterized protein YfaS (alpha-2-macroglobulin family)
MSINKWILYLLLLLLPLFAIAKESNKYTIAVKELRTTETEKKVGLCLLMDETSYADMKIQTLKSYIKLVPKQEYTLSWNYNDLCIKGLKPETEYSITAYKNMPLGKYILDKDYTLEGKTGNYDASIYFPEEGYILPTKGEISIPMESMNLHKVSLSLYRINDRNLITNINRSGLLRTISSYKLDNLEERDGYLLWKKELEIRDIGKNIRETTAIPVGDFLKKREAGVYILYAQMLNDEGEEEYEYETKMQWFMVSDIGLYTLKSKAGLKVITKTLSSAKAYNNVKLELISQNNEVLETLYSKEGEAFFPSTLLGGKKGLKAKAIYAYGENDDFSVLDLSRPAHDLSDRGVVGRKSLGEYGAFIYSNRDIFRPSETITFHALLREHLGDAKAGVSVSVKIFDAREEEVYSRQFKSDALGHLSDSMVLDSSVSTGRWQIKLYRGEEEAIGSYSFLVEDFVPPKIKVLVEESNNILKLTSKYLNGEIFPHARVEVNTIIHQAKMPSPKYKEYHFGDSKKTFSAEEKESIIYETDSQGRVDIEVDLTEKYDTSFPLSAQIKLVVSELGGRPIHKRIEKAFDNHEGYIGIKSLFKNNAVDMERKPKFDIIYLKNRVLSKKSLYYKVIVEDTHWSWRSHGDSWAYYKTYSDEGIQSEGTVQTLSTEPLGFSLPPLDWGSYRLEIFDGNKSISTYRFSSGYEESSSKASPDRLPLSISKQSYSVGDTLKVNIHSKFKGPVMVSIAHHNILETQHIDVEAGKDTEVSFIVKDTWGSSAYVLATAFRGQSKKLGANRAIGLSAFKVLHPEKELTLKLSHPPRVMANNVVTVKVSSKDLRHKTYFTLAAVDEGVLNLTDYTLPNPIEYFFGQQQLDIEIRDIYSDLIEAKGTHGKFKVGAGDIKDALKDKDIPNKRKVVALFSEVLAFDANGMAEVNLSIPDYQGSLKLVAVAWNDKALGVKESTLIVKDDISIEYYMPSFISMGDSVESLIAINFDTSLEAGVYDISLRTTGGLHIDRKEFSANISPTNNKFEQNLSLFADGLEEGSMTIEVSQKGKIVQSKVFELSIRTPYPSVYIRKIDRLDTHASLKPQSIINQMLWNNIHNVSLKLSAKSLFPKISLESELIDYQGRCAEQTTSRAMPWLFSKKTAEKSLIIKKAIQRLLSYQNISGGFALWQGQQTDMWLSAYVLDFLSRANTAGYTVPEYNLKKGLRWLEDKLNRWSDNTDKKESDIYALYVLAREGRILMSEIKYHTEKTQLINSSLTLGHLGASLALVGEKDLAKKMFEKAENILHANHVKSYYYNNYGGVLRNQASLISLMAESNLNDKWEKLYADLALNLDSKEYFSTQELSVLLRASLLVNDNHIDTLNLLINNTKVYRSKEDYLHSSKTLLDMPMIQNQTAMSLWYDLSFKATADASYYTAKENKGFSISKTIYTLKGDKVDLDNIPQNERLVVVIDGKIENKYIEHPLISDWLPAGFEIENPNLTGVDTLSSLKWLGKTSRVKNTAYRNDRFETALAVNKLKEGNFQVAYMLRVVSRGTFVLAPSKIEDMYKPRYRGFSAFRAKPIVIKEKVDTIVLKSSTAFVDTLQASDYLAITTAPIPTLAYYTIVEVNVLRNAIFAKAGLSFEKTNPMLHKRFLPYPWYIQKTIDSSAVYASFSNLEVGNVQMLLAEEKARGGGLVLADFYRVSILTLDKKSLEKYTKNDLYILRNSLFARYGLTFKEKSLERIFAFMPWYEPRTISVSEIFDVQMSQREKDNILLMIELEKSF